MEKNWLVRHGWEIALFSEEGVVSYFKDNIPKTLSKKEEFEMARFGYINSSDGRVERVEKALKALMGEFVNKVLSNRELIYAWSIEVNTVRGEVVLRRVSVDGEWYRDEKIIFNFLNDRNNVAELIDKGIIALNGTSLGKDIDVLEKLFWELVG